MTGLILEPIGPENIERVADLLQARNGTSRDYTRWKYGPNDGRPRGFLARSGRDPVGCFGLVPRDLTMPGPRQVPCGWFADWYVHPRAQGSGVGTQLLAAVRESYPVVFGHPRPDRAQALCRANGFRPIRFQVLRRLVLIPMAYARVRTRYALKAMTRAAILWFQRQRTRWLSMNAGGRDLSKWANSGMKPFFNRCEEYGDWIAAQPVAVGPVARRWGVWRKAGLELRFMDDRFPSGDTRRRILFSAGPSRTCSGAWDTFARASQRTGISHIEGFTTEPDLDRAWQALGARAVQEPPVLVSGLGEDVSPLALHGWDRENWTFL